MIELTVSIKHSDGTYKQKFLEYNPVAMTLDDPIVNRCVEEAINNLKLPPEEIKVRTLLLFERENGRP